MLLLLSDTCLQYPAGATVVQHETMHSMGFMHEHQRPDRDRYVTFNKNAIKGANILFEKLGRLEVGEEVGAAYDIA